MNVYLVTSGDGSDGDTWRVESIQPTREAALAYIAAYNAHWSKRLPLYADGIEEWPVGVPFTTLALTAP